MKPLDYDIRDEFSIELNKIKYCLDGLRNKRVYELSKTPGDGSIGSYADKIEEEINRILTGLQNECGGMQSAIGNILSKTDANKNKNVL